MLLTLSEVKQHLRYDEEDTSNDMILSSYILAAEAAIKNYIRKDIDVTTKPDIKVAVMLLVGYFDLHRNAEVQLKTTDTKTNSTYLPYPVLYLLTSYRQPTVI